MKTIIAKLKFMLRNLSLASTRAGASFVSVTEKMIAMLLQ
jgi:hypothetical protein